MSSDVAALPPDLGQCVMGELQPGERIVYAGRPDWRAEVLKLAAVFLFGTGWSAISFPFAYFALAAALGHFPLSAGSGSLAIGYGVNRDSDGGTHPLQTDWSGIPDVRRAEAAMRA